MPQTGQEKRTEWEEEDALAIKLGSVLWTKLNKRYWELGHVAGMPLVLAVADFHTDEPMRATSSALPGISTARIPSSSRTAEAWLNAKPIV